MKTIGQWLVTIIGGLLVVGTFIPFIRSEKWWIREFEFPRLQLAILMAITAALLFVFFNKAWEQRVVAIALLLCIIYQLAEIFPYTPVAPRQTLPSTHRDPAQTISLLISNILMDNREAGRFLTEVEHHNPDIVLILEPDEWWGEQISSLKKNYPHVVQCPLGNTYGIILYSRLPFQTAEVRYLVSDTIPSIFATVKLPSGQEVDLYCVHPPPPIPTIDSEQRDAELLIVAREVAKRNRPRIVIGDLNDVAWSQTTKLFQKISGLLDPRRGRGFYNSYHAGYFFLRYPLDHVFHSNEFRLLDIRRGNKIGSDHFPIYAAFTYEPEKTPQQEEPKAEPEDQEQADEKIEKGFEKKDGGD